MFVPQPAAEGVQLQRRKLQLRSLKISTNVLQPILRIEISKNVSTLKGCQLHRMQLSILKRFIPAQFRKQVFYFADAFIQRQEIIDRDIGFILAANQFLDQICVRAAHILSVVQHNEVWMLAVIKLYKLVHDLLGAFCVIADEKIKRFLIIAVLLLVILLLERAIFVPDPQRLRKQRPDLFIAGPVRIYF